MINAYSLYYDKCLLLYDKCILYNITLGQERYKNGPRVAINACYLLYFKYNCQLKCIIGLSGPVMKNKYHCLDNFIVGRSLAGQLIGVD